MLAVDLGVRTGLARYARDGRLLWYRSHNFGSSARLRRAIPALLDTPPRPEALILEGGGPLAELWQRAAERRALPVQQLHAETWRQRLLLPRQQRSGELAKQQAGQLARAVIAWSGAPRPTSLRHDTAEAILVGLWGVLARGWLAELPDALRHPA